MQAKAPGNPAGVDLIPRLAAVAERHDAPGALSGLLGDRGRPLCDANRSLARAFGHACRPLGQALAGLRRALHCALANLRRAMRDALNRPLGQRRLCRGGEEERRQK